MDLNKYLSPDVLAQHSKIKQQFTSAYPFSHVLIEGFFQESFCRELLASFPAFDKKRAINEDGVIGNKSVNELITGLPEPYPNLDLLVKSPEFLELVSKLTGISELKFDPHYFGGGTHENRHGQSLDAHIDFNHHPITDQHRRLNLIVYLNDEWEREWGGLIDLHRDPYLPPELDDIKSYPPLFNHCVIFETSEHSWHGFTRINQPEDKRQLSRKSLALYYYTDERPPKETGPHHSTVYVEQHLPPDIKTGVTLSEDQYQLIQNMMSGRDQHLKRLYGYIADLSEQLHQARPQDQKTEVAFEQEAAPENTDELIRHLKIRNAALNNELQVFRNSRSWRLTAPLRWLNTHLTGLKAPHLCSHSFICKVMYYV